MSRRPRSFSERYPDNMRSGSSYNLIAGELNEARRLIPRVDLRNQEAVRQGLMFKGLEPFPRRPFKRWLRDVWRDHHPWVVLPVGYAAFCGACWGIVQVVHMLG